MNQFVQVYGDNIQRKTISLYSISQLVIVGFVVIYGISNTYLKCILFTKLC